MLLQFQITSSIYRSSKHRQIDNKSTILILNEYDSTLQVSKTSAVVSNFQYFVFFLWLRILDGIIILIQFRAGSYLPVLLDNFFPRFTGMFVIGSAFEYVGGCAVDGWQYRAPDSWLLIDSP